MAVLALLGTAASWLPAHAGADSTGAGVGAAGSLASHHRALQFTSTRTTTGTGSTTSGATAIGTTSTASSSSSSSSPPSTSASTTTAYGPTTSSGTSTGTSGTSSGGTSTGGYSNSGGTAVTYAPTMSPVGSSGSSAAGGATASPSATPGPAGDFNIQLLKFGDGDAKYDVFMERAAARWMQVIVGDVQDMPGNSAADLFQDFFGANAPAQPLPDSIDVDDIIIGYQIAPIDGPLNVVGSTAALAVRPPEYGSFPYSAGMTFDSADADAAIADGTSDAVILHEDADAAIADGTFDAVILHEMGHALGFAESLWPLYPSQCGTSCTYFATGAPNGCLASQKFTELGFDGPLPMYFQGSPNDGSFCSHWDETVLGNELMTPGIAEAEVTSPLTEITIAAYEDIGYQVSYASADPISQVVPAQARWKDTPLNRMLAARRVASARYKPRQARVGA